jgi:hypothetical protein
LTKIRKDEFVTAIQKEVEEIREGLNDDTLVEKAGLELAPFDENAVVPEIWKDHDASYRKWLTRVTKDLNTFRVDPPDETNFDRSAHGYGDLCAIKCLGGDEALSQARFSLVPKM